MVTFRNNNRRGRFRSNDRGFKRIGDGPKYKSDFHTNSDFQRKSLNRNNHNPSKLIEKYNNLAREALANEDKILSESYFQFADHFTRVLGEREKNQSIREKYGMMARRVACDYLSVRKAAILHKEHYCKVIRE